MKKQRYLYSLLLLIATPSIAGVLDRSGQGVDILFSEGNVIEYQKLRVNPDITGEDSLSQSTGSVSQSFTLQQLNINTQINANLSAVFMIDQPWGADFSYANSSILYGGTAATLDSLTLTGALKKQFDNQVSIFGGLRFQELQGELALDGLAYGPIAGYRLSTEKDHEYGYILGSSYERKEYGLLIAFTYQSEVEHTLNTDENISPTPTTTKIVAPQSINIDFRTGIAPNTLAFARARWVEWSAFTFKPEALGFEVTSFDEDTISYTLGLARQLSPSVLASFAWLYEPEFSSTNSLFQPSNGYQGFALGANYQASEHWQLNAYYSMTEVGNASAETEGGNSVQFRNNTSDSFKLGLTYRY